MGSPIQFQGVYKFQYPSRQIYRAALNDQDPNTKKSISDKTTWIHAMPELDEDKMRVTVETELSRMGCQFPLLYRNPQVVQAGPKGQTKPAIEIYALTEEDADFVAKDLGMDLPAEDVAKYRHSIKFIQDPENLARYNNAIKAYVQYKEAAGAPVETIVLSDVPEIFQGALGEDNDSLEDDYGPGHA